MGTALVLLLLEIAASLWGSISSCGVLRSRRGLVRGQSQLKYEAIFWSFEE